MEQVDHVRAFSLLLKACLNLYFRTIPALKAIMRFWIKILLAEVLLKKVTELGCRLTCAN